MTFLSTHLRAALVALICAALLLACQPSDPVAEPHEPVGTPALDLPSAAWTTFIDEQIEAYLAAHPAWAVVQGRHEYDGQLPDWSADAIAAEIARLRAGRELAREFSAEELGPQGE